jgi:hypothetical protein
MQISWIDCPGTENLDMEIPRGRLGSNEPPANALNVPTPNPIAIAPTKVVAFAFIFRVIEHAQATNPM